MGMESKLSVEATIQKQKISERYLLRHCSHFR